MVPLANSPYHRSACRKEDGSMRTRTWLSALLGALILSGSAMTFAPTRADAYVSTQVSISYFYDSMAPYGRWVDYAPYGWCWTPYDADYGWRPYTEGHWIYTAYGWTWVSDEPWGWAAYHYGRWTYDPYYGWLWVPGRVWGPAWVAWRYDDQCVGWAPLPPAAVWDASVGFRYVSYDVPVRSWCFVERRGLLDGNVRTRLISESRNVTLVRQTRDVTRFDVREGRPINSGLAAAVVQRWTGRSVRQVPLTDVSTPSRSGRPASQGAVGIYRPHLRDEGAEAPRPERTQRAEPRPTMGDVLRDHDQRRRRLESGLADEQARLQREQVREERQARPDVRPQVRERHSDERQAFQRQAQEQRQVFENRWQRNVSRPAREQDDSRGKSHGRGHGRGHGDDDEGGSE